MDIDFDVSSIESALANEIYISAVPEKNASVKEQAKIIFSNIRDIISSKNAFILQERLFAAEQVMEEMLHARSSVYGCLYDGVNPSLLLGKKGMTGPISGVQIHAIYSDKKPHVVNINGNACGRVLHLPDNAILTLSSINAPQFEQASEQARAMMEKGEYALKLFGADFLTVARTWMWLGDILLWYGDFNRVRNKFFTERGRTGQPAINAGKHRNWTISCRR